MASDNTWEEIAAELSRLIEDNSLVSFHPLIEKLKIYSSAQPPKYPPEFYRTFIALVQQMSNDVEEGNDVLDVLTQAIQKKGSYSQPDWDVNNVYQSSGQAFQFILNNFRSEIKPRTAPTHISIPVVLLVMNVDEAQELFSGAAFKDYPNSFSAEFKRLAKLLEKKQLTDWIKRYGSTSRDWRPFADVDQSIEEVINNTLGKLTEYKKPVIPEFCDIRNLNEDRAKLKDLRMKGCILIKDLISMRHPLIQREYRRSLLDAFPNTPVVRVTPLTDALSLTQRMINFSEQYIDLEFYKRMTIDLDDRCRQVSQAYEFGGWLKAYAPDVVSEEDKNDGVRDQFFTS
jgi:hypothetical protein